MFILKNCSLLGIWLLLMGLILTKLKSSGLRLTFQDENSSLGCISKMAIRVAVLYGYYFNVKWREFQTVENLLTEARLLWL